MSQSRGNDHDASFDVTGCHYCGRDGREEDADAILDASHAGVSVIATAHAKDLEDARGRPVLRRLLDDGGLSALR